MTNYVKATDFAAKDALLTGSPAKIIKGTEINTEFDAIATAVATKADSIDITNMLETSDIGVTVQAYDADLTSWAAIAPSAKQDALVSGTNIKTINSASLLGSGDITLATLAGNTFTGAQVLSDQLVSRAMLIDFGMTYLDKGNSGTSTQTLDYTAGSHQKITATGNHTIATSNWPPTGNLGELLLELTNGGAYTITWPTISWIKPDGTTTTSISTYLAALTGRTALQSSGTDFVLLWSRDAGTTIYGKLV